MIKTICVLSAGLLMSACISQKQPSNFTSIQFGSGGGFTGAVEGFELKEGIIRSLNEPNPEIVKSLTSKEVDVVREQVDSLDTLVFEKSANMYQFIEIIDSGKKVRYQWGINDQEVPDQLQELFQTLMAHTK